MAKPEKRFRCGGCDVAVFENEIVKDGKTIRMKKISMQKRYVDSEGNWKTASSLDTNDLPKAILALSKAYEYLTLTDPAKNESKESA